MSNGKASIMVNTLDADIVAQSWQISWRATLTMLASAYSYMPLTLRIGSKVNTLSLPFPGHSNGQRSPPTPTLL